MSVLDEEKEKMEEREETRKDMQARDERGRIGKGGTKKWGLHLSKGAKEIL